MEPETPVFSLSLCALTNCSVQAESVWLIVIYKRDLEENWKWELVSIISQIEYIFFYQYKRALLWFFDHIDSQNVCWYADARNKAGWEWGMANEGLGRERQGEKTNRENKGSQEGFSYISFAYCCSVNTAPPQHLDSGPQ